MDTFSRHFLLSSTDDDETEGKERLHESWLPSLCPEKPLVLAIGL